MTEAIIIHHFQHWIGVNQRKPNGKKTSFRDGKWWTYQTIDDIAAHFPYLSKSQVVTAIERLCNGKTRFGKEKKFEPVLVKGNFNKMKFDHTVWYSFVNEKKFAFLWKHKIDAVETQKGTCGNTKPIPDTKTDTKTNITNPPNPPKAPKPKDPEKVGVRDCVFLSKEELAKLEALYQNKSGLLELMLDLLDSYKDSKGKKYKSDYGVLKRNGWVHKRAVEQLGDKKSQGFQKDTRPMAKGIIDFGEED
jgi:hypothetical protein